MSQEFVQVATFFDAWDAHILRGLLESDDIEVRLFDEQTASLLPIYPSMLGGVKVLVEEGDLAKAKRITDEYFSNIETQELMKCPSCESIDLRNDYKTYLSSFGLNILGIFTGGYSLSSSSCKYKQCKDCGYTW